MMAGGAVCQGVNQIGEIAVLGNDDSLLPHGEREQIGIAPGRVFEGGPDDVMTLGLQRLRNCFGDVDVEQKPQAAFACPIAT